jgi:hypothetical protein
VYGFSNSRVRSSSKFQGCTINMKSTSRYKIVECYGDHGFTVHRLLISYSMLQRTLQSSAVRIFLQARRLPCKMMNQVKLAAVRLTAIHTPIKSLWHRNKTEFSSLWLYHLFNISDDCEVFT